MRSLTLNFLALSFCWIFSTVTKAQSSPSADIPACVVGLLNHYYLDDQVVGFLQNPSFIVKQGENKSSYHHGAEIMLSNWEGEHPDFTFLLATENRLSLENTFFTKGTNLKSITFKAKSKASSERCFKSILASFKLTDDPKINKPILKKGNYPNLEINKNGEVLEVKFMPNTNFSIVSHYISLKWNMRDKSNPWLETVTMESYGVNKTDVTCFKGTPLILSRPQVDLNDSRTYWRAIGMTLTENDRKAFHFHKSDWVVRANSISTRDGLYTFITNQDGDTRKIISVVYNHSSKFCSSPFIYVKTTLHELRKRHNENYNMDDGFQLYGQDPLHPKNSHFMVEFQTDINDYITTITVKAEDSLFFENSMRGELEDLLYPKNCFDGNCRDKIGSKYYSDGYYFIGQWRENKPDFGFVYTREGIVIDIIENRITTDEARARRMAKQNEDYENMHTTLEVIHKNKQAIANNWNGHMLSIAEYFTYSKKGKAEMVGSMKNAVKYLSKCSENCDNLVEQASILSRIYSKYDFCAENISLLNNIEKNSNEIKEEVNGVMRSINKANSSTEYDKIVEKYQKQIETLLNEIQDDYHQIVKQYNTCVENQ
tara:strand:- start:155 stop:1951 length:1797 start_codon:yes stop_codon:yes gene_type:complete